MVNELMRLLGIIVKKDDPDEKKKLINEMNDEFLLFIKRNFSTLYLHEIVSAFEKAISGELVDHKGNRFDIFPRLDNIITGKVLSRWKEQKINNQPYQLAKTKLLTNNKLGIDESVLIENREKRYFNYIISALYSGAEPRYIGAEFLYDDLINNIYPISQELPLEEQKKLKSKYIQEQNILYKREEKIFYSNKKRGILENLRKIERDESDKPIIQSRCRSIKVCEHLTEKYINTIMNNFVENLEQPLAHLIATEQINTINKSFSTDFRGVVKIRANDILKNSNQFTKNQFQTIPELLQRRIINQNFITNAIIGEVEIIDCVIGFHSIWAEVSDTDQPIYNWVLANAKLYDEPIDDMKGDFSYWELKQKTTVK